MADVQKRPTVTQKTDDNEELLVTRESVLNELKSKLEQRFNSLRAQAEHTVSIWERYELDIILKELKVIYDTILK